MDTDEPAGEAVIEEETMEVDTPDGPAVIEEDTMAVETPEGEMVMEEDTIVVRRRSPRTRRPSRTRARRRRTGQPQPVYPDGAPQWRSRHGRSGLQALRDQKDTRSK